MGNLGSAPDSITLNQEEPDSENETCNEQDYYNENEENVLDSQFN